MTLAISANISDGQPWKRLLVFKIKLEGRIELVHKKKRGCPCIFVRYITEVTIIYPCYLNINSIIETRDLLGAELRWFFPMSNIYISNY